MTSDSVTVRLYRDVADLAGINRVRDAVRAVEGDGWFPGPDSGDAEAEHTRRCLIAETTGAIVGYAWMTWWRETNNIRLYLLLGWVAPAWRRRGIGGTLLRRQIEQAAELAAHEGGVPILGGNAGENQPATRDLRDFHRDEIEGKDVGLWHVAWSGDLIVALVISEIDGDGLSDTRWVAVHPDRRRRGLAKTLLRRNLALLAERGVRKATITTVAENRNNTLALYRNTGFEVIRRHPRYRRPL